MIINMQYFEWKKHNKKEKNWEEWESVLCIKIRPTIIKQHYNLFKYFTKGGEFIGDHTSLATFFTSGFSKISVIPAFVNNNSCFFTTFFYTIDIKFFIFKTMVSNPHCQYERLRSCFSFL